MELNTDYEIAKTFISAHLASMTSKQKLDILGASNLLASKLESEITLRKHIYKHYLESEKYGQYFKNLSKQQFSRLIKIPVKQLPAKFISIL